MTLVAVLTLLFCVVNLSLQADQGPSCSSTHAGLRQCYSYTPVLGISQCGELDLTVNGLESVFSGAAPIPPVFFGVKGFLRVLAFVETRDGRNWTSCKDGGIWNVDYTNLERCFQFFFDIYVIFLSATGALGLQPGGYDCPANSAFGAVLLMLCNMITSSDYPDVTAAAADLPTEPDSFPSFYARYYCHPSCSESEAIEKFTAGMQEYLSTPCGPAVDNCSEQFDIIVLLDSSESIGAGQFADALAAVANLSSRYTIGSNYTRFSVILYSHIIHNTRDEDVIALDEYSDSASLTAAILSLPYHRGGTLTGNAITYATEHGFNRSFGARESGTVPRVIIVATDGQSCDSVSGPAKAAADDGIILFSIGIGDGPDQEQLLDIAGGVSSRVFNTVDYRHLIGLSPLLAAESCRAQVSVPPGEQIEYTLIMGKVKYFQISIPENCSQSLMVSFVANSSSDSILVYASFTIPNPNKRLYDYKWNVSAEQVSVTIPFIKCTGQQRQALPSESDQPCSPPCQNGGSCLPPDHCLCTHGWTGPSRSQPICSVTCQNGGHCYAPDRCRCTAEWAGQDCSLAICTTSTSSNGTCVTPDTCGCSDKWPRRNCTSSICSPPCQNGGSCISPDSCVCSHGWTGPDCSQPLYIPECANGGTCVAPQQCSCVEGWTGSSCDIAVCSPDCGNGGTCVAPNHCTCPPGWTGDTCLQATCSPPCQNGGSCVSPDRCVCTQSWTAPDCSHQACASGAQPSCPTAGLRHGPTTCGTCRQLLEHSYCEGLDQVVANLSGLEPFTSFGVHSAFFEPQGFLRLLAFVETQDGLLLSDCDKGGVWNVDYKKLANCLGRGSLLLYPYSAEYIFTVSLTDSFTYEDFNCPENSAFAALLLLVCNSNTADPVTTASGLPTEPDSFPSFYARYYCHPSCSKREAEMKFMEGMQAFEGCSRRRRQVVSPFTSNDAKLTLNADIMETAEDSMLTTMELQHSSDNKANGEHPVN